MSKRQRLFQPGTRGLDTNLLVVLIFIMVFGFVMIYSASYYTAGMSKAYNNDPMYLLKNQIIYSMLGIIAMLVVASINYHFWCRFATLGYIVCIGLIFLLKTPLGVTVKGATRWIRIAGVQFQVAEPVKLIMIVFMATLIAAKGRHLKGWIPMFRLLIPSGIIAVLLWKISDNMSTATILLGTAVFMIYVVHPDQWKFILCALGVAIFVGLVIHYVQSLDPATMDEINFRFARIRAWLDPYEYEDGKAYQSLQGLYAIGSGGLFGRGLGKSVQKLGFLPEAQNDMIFSIICEELGLVGASLIILLFLILIWRFFVIATHAKDLTGALIATGAMAHMMIQVILNIAVVTNSIPNTGITLPFISYGGTSVVFLLLEMGLVLSVSNLVE